MSPVRFGILGAARIAPPALIKPARAIGDAEVLTIAARDPLRAAAFAKKHGVPRTAASYDAVLDDPDVDAVYIPLPNNLHAEWTLAALAAGKHVLCEKPFTSNMAEAEKVAEAASTRPDLVVMEAFHYRYHPVADRMREIVDSGELGTIQRVETAMCFPLPKFGDIRYRYELAGGATMDAGCYAVHAARLLGGEEPEVTGAAAKVRGPNIDRAMTAQLRFPSGATGRVMASMWSSDAFRMTARAVGDDGELKVLNPFGPQYFHRIVVRAAGARRVEKLSRRPTYEFHLEAFCNAVLRGGPVLTPPADSIANMKVIDAIYASAGLPLRAM